MTRRVLLLLGARLRAGPKGGLPIAAWLAQALFGAVFCGLVADALPPFAYGVFAFTLATVFVAIPLLGELGWLLRRDAAEDWVGTLPLRAAELRLARMLHVLVALWSLALASLVPAALLAPAATEPLGRVLLPFLGLGMVTLLAALLLALQSLLGARAEAALVLLQTLLVVGVVVGLVVGLRHVPALARLPHPGDAGGAFLWAVPPAWFAAPLAAAEGEPSRWWLAASAFAASLAVLALLPAPVNRHQRGESPLALLLRPARALAARLWVRPDERGVFDLVHDALPKEREVVLRTYPMVGIPLAFLVVAATGPEGGPGASRQDLLALLLFTAGIYLPVLLTQVPASVSFRARWILDTAPVPEGAVVAGTIKALGVRFLLPLYGVLGLLSWTLAGADFTLRLLAPAALVSLLVLRLLYPVCVRDRPLSTSPDELVADLDWTGVLAGVAIALTLVSVAASRLATWPVALGATLVLLGFEAVLQRRLRRTQG